MRNSFLQMALMAHFLSDYPFQTNRLAYLKSISIKGVQIHTTICLLIHMIVLSLFGVQGLIYGALFGIIHGIVDYGKYRLVPKQAKQIGFYFLDQVIHLTFIIFSCIRITLPSKIVIYGGHIASLNAILVCTYFSTVTAKVILRDCSEKVKNQVFFLPEERILDAITGLILWISTYLAFVMGIMVVIIVGWMIYDRIQQRKFHYTHKEIFIKYSVYSICAILAKTIFK